MTRAEMKRAEREKKKGEVRYSLTQAQIDAIAKETENKVLERLNEISRRMKKESANNLYKTIICLPTVVLHDHLEEIMKAEAPEEIFVDYVMDMYEMVNDDLVTVEQLEEMMLEETGIKFEEMNTL